MAQTVRFGSGVFKDAQGNVVHIQGLTENDVNKIKEYHGKVDTLERQLKAVNAGQRQLAYKDYYTTEDYKSEMAVGVYYSVPFNAQGQFLEFDQATGKPKNPQTVGTVVDLKVSYYEIVYKSSDETVAKLGRQNADASMEHVLNDNTNETITADYTFDRDITVNATQDVDALGDTKVATAKFVRDLVSRRITETAHMAGKFYDTGAPEDGSLVTNELAFYPATNLIA